MCVSERENLSVRLSQDDFDLSPQNQQQQWQQRSRDDDDDDDGGGGDDGPMNQSETRPADVPHYRHRHGTDAESGHRDAAVQVKDMTRRSSSTQVHHIITLNIIIAVSHHFPDLFC